MIFFCHRGANPEQWFRRNSFIKARDVNSQRVISFAFSILPNVVSLFIFSHRTLKSSLDKSPEVKVELVNSKRLLYTASHVATKLDAPDIADHAGKPTGAFKKAAFLKALDINRETLHRISELE